jgi:spermidine synthase
MPHLLLALSFASGMCGIAYEILYSRLLTTYLGDMYFVSAAILAAFLFGIAVGSLAARRLMRWLWAIELLIGVYAAALVAGFSIFGNGLLGYIHPHIAGSPILVVLAVFAMLIVPASLVGTSVPLFAAYLRGYSSTSPMATWFDRVYALYNLGATSCVLVIEFVLLRRLGIRSTLLAMAGVNLVSATALFFIPPPVAAQTEFAAPTASLFDRRGLALFVVSVASGLFQMIFLKFVEVFFGPYHENFAVSVALALLGISLGTLWVNRRPSTFQQLLLRGSTLLSVSFILLYPIVRFWGHVNAALSDLGWSSTPGKIICLALLGLVPFAVFGSTVPALVREKKEAGHAAGTLLFLSSIGNAVGYLSAVFWVYEHASYRAMVLMLAGALGVGCLLVDAGRCVRERLRESLLAVAAMAALAATWPEWFFALEYQVFVSPSAFAQTRANIEKTEVLRRFDSQISVVTTTGGVEALNINGYRSLMAYRGHTIATEIVYGLAPTVYAPRRGSALVLGVGTGMTAGTVALLFDKLTAVEINPAMLELLPRWREHNFNLHQRPNASLVLDDGLSYMARPGERYDAILNTVNGPLYFSSSKLYTRDFFELVKSRLAPDGIYTFWFDSRATEEGARIIFATVTKSFADCAFVYLRSGYCQVICSPQPLHPRPLSEADWPAPIREKLATQLLTPVATLVESLALPRHHLFDTDWGARINTFDLPVLEYTMASRSLQLDAGAFRVYEMLGIDFRAAIGRSEPLSDEELARRCAHERILGGIAQPECLAALGITDTSLAPYEYIRPVLGALRGTTEGERVTLVGRLLALDRADLALDELREIEADSGDTPTTRLLRAWAELRKSGDVSDAELADLVRLDPVSPDVRRAIVSTMVARRRWDQVLVHLQVLKRMRAFGEREAKLEELAHSFLAGSEP